MSWHRKGDTSVARYLSVGLVAVLAVGFLVTHVTGGAPDEQKLVAIFKDAGPLEVGSEVRAAGVRVGTVRSIDLKDGMAHIGLKLDDSVLAVHQDATVNIRPINVLGENYVELNQGSDSAPMLSGDVITAEHTTNSVTLQGVLDTFDAPTSTALAALVTTLGEGVNGNGTEIADAIKALAPSMIDVAELGRVLSDQNRVLGQVVAQADPVAQALATDNGRSMDNLVGSTEKMLSALAANTSAVEQTLEQLPSTLDEADRSLSLLTKVSGSTTPLLVSLRPITQNLDQVSTELTDFAGVADPALASLEPVLAHAQALLANAAPVAADLRAGGPNLRSVARNARPLGDQLIDQHLGDLMAFVRKWALSTNGRDGLSHYFRGVVHVTPRSLESLLGLNAPLTPSGKPPSTKDPLGDALGGLLNPLTEGLNGVLGGLGLSKGATGLSPSQESNLLSQLLGGL